MFNITDGNLQWDLHESLLINKFGPFSSLPTLCRSCQPFDQAGKLLQPSRRLSRKRERGKRSRCASLTLTAAYCFLFLLVFHQLGECQQFFRQKLKQVIQGKNANQPAAVI